VDGVEIELGGVTWAVGVGHGAETALPALQVQRELAWLYAPAGGRIAASVAAQTARRDDEFARLDAAGMTEVSLQGEAADRYLAAARDETFKRMREQMEKHPMGLKNYDTLIEKFYVSKTN
jgi:hypothetical protein